MSGKLLLVSVLILVNQVYSQNAGEHRNALLADRSTIEVNDNGAIYYDVRPQYKRNYTADELKKFVPTWSGSARYIDNKTGEYFDDVSQAKNTYFDRATNQTYYLNEMHPLAAEMIRKANLSNSRETRQASAVLRYCTDINMGGYCDVLYTNPNFGLPSLPAPYDMAISSFSLLLPYNYMISVCTGTTYSGTCWSFQTPYAVNDLRPYLILNDAIRSILIVSYATLPIVTFYEDYYFQGRSVPAYANSYPTMSVIPNAASGNKIANDAVSSYVVYSNTKVDFYSDASYGGSTFTEPKRTSLWSVSVMPAGWNDIVSSIVVS